MNQKTRSEKLMFIWLISFGIATFVSAIYVNAFSPNNCLPPVTVPWGYQLVILLCVCFYFYPLLFVIHHHAKKDNVRGIAFASIILLVWISLFLAVYFYFLFTDPINLLM